MQRSYLFLILSLFAFKGFAQDKSIELIGLVVNATNDQRLENVNVSIESVLDRGGVTNALGEFTLQVDSLPTVLIISSIGFETKKIVVEKKEELLISLFPMSTELPQIVVSAARKVDTVYHEPYNVVDYVFKDDFLILLVYRNFREKYELVLLDQEENFVAKFPLTDYLPVSLFKSCLKDVYLTTTNGVYHIKFDEHSIGLGDWVNQREYDYVIEPCILTVDSLLFYRRHLYQGQVLRYYAFKINAAREDSITVLPQLEYEENIVRLLEDLGASLPWSGDFWDENISNKLRLIREEPYFLKGANRMFHPKLYAPIIEKDSLIYLFNHLESQLQYFDVKGNQLRSIPINYHKIKRWKKYILYDEITQEVYTAFHTKWGEYICEIDLETGTLSEAIPLDLDFIEKVSIRDGVLYFLHRNDYKGAQNRMIQKIRVN